MDRINFCLETQWNSTSETACRANASNQLEAARIPHARLVRLSY